MDGRDSVVVKVLILQTVKPGVALSMAVYPQIPALLNTSSYLPPFKDQQTGF